MIEYIAGGLSSLKAARDLAKGLVELKESVAVQLKAAELLGIIGDVQGSLLEAQERIDGLQAELRAAKAQLEKVAQFDRYKLVEPYPGTIVFQLRDECRQADEPMHFICPRCREDGFLAYMAMPNAHRATTYCKRCGKGYQVRAAENNANGAPRLLGSAAWRDRY